jgi:hypothetical protein
MDIMGVYGKLRASAIQSDTLYQRGSLWCGRFIQQGSWIGVFDRTSRRYYQSGTAIPYKGSSSTNQVIRWERKTINYYSGVCIYYSQRVQGWGI